MARPSRIISVLAVLLALAVPSLAQSVSVSWDGQLLVEGSAGDDTIILTEWWVGDAPMGVNVSINGVDYGDFTLSDRTGLTVRGWSGNDTIDLSAVTTHVFFLDAHPGFPSTVTGDNGDDLIRGTQGNDVIYGIAGDDTIHGERGNDTLLGGDGNDTLYGDDGNDVVEGETGPYDNLFGGCGKDKIADKDGALTVSGGDGEDKLIVIFPAGWTHGGLLASDGLISGGYDADYFEIFNQSATPFFFTVFGDEFRGYDNGGDMLYTFGPITSDSTFPQVDKSLHF